MGLAHASAWPRDFRGDLTTTVWSIDEEIDIIDLLARDDAADEATGDDKTATVGVDGRVNGFGKPKNTGLKMSIREFGEFLCHY